MLSARRHAIAAGNQQLTVNLTDRSGRSLTQGVYIMQVEHGGRRTTEKIVKL